MVCAKKFNANVIESVNTKNSDGVISELFYILLRNLLRPAAISLFFIKNTFLIACCGSLELYGGERRKFISCVFVDDYQEKQVSELMICIHTKPCR